MTDSPAPHDDPLAFAPVPSATDRHDGWTPERQRRFIQALAVMGSVAPAARAVGKSATAAYALRRRAGGADFAQAWDTAVAMAKDRWFEMAMDRAINGVAVPRFYAGRQVATVRRPDFRLALAAIRGIGAPSEEGRAHLAAFIAGE